MKTKAILAAMIAVLALAVLARFGSRTHHSASEPDPSAGNFPESPAVPLPEANRVANGPMRPPETAHYSRPITKAPQSDLPVLATDKPERLAQIRDRFQAIATGDPGAALRAAKQIADGTERETAHLALVTQWTHGELRPPRERARAIDNFGLEAGLGLELAKHPELAVAWANELTDGPGRVALLRQTAVAMTGSDPAAAFSLSDQLPEPQRRQFSDSVFAGWAAKDTEAALQWADQLPEPAQREQAIQVIRTEAPTGIGAAVGIKDGCPVVMQLMPGTPAELSGQIHAGDRILALAQGDSSFVNAQGIPLSDLVQMIRGAPGTTLELQILSADAPPGSSPQTISITRDQIKFKH